MNPYSEALHRLDAYRIGCDEAGRGPLAGPLVVVAVGFSIVMDTIDWPHTHRLRDSKTYTSKAGRQEMNTLYDLLMNDDRVFKSVVTVQPKRIDEINIFQATLEAAGQAISNVYDAMTKNDRFDYRFEGPKCDIVMDGNAFPRFPPHHRVPLRYVRTVIDADKTHPAVSAASILAKVTRDRLMDELATLYPQYGFDKHHGYGTALHREKLKEHGPCCEHRASFEPVKSFLRTGKWKQYTERRSQPSSKPKNKRKVDDQVLKTKKKKLKTGVRHWEDVLSDVRLPDRWEPDEQGAWPVYTDGACENNQNASQAKAGCGVFFARQHPLNCQFRLTGLQTNNRAEITAALVGLRQAAKELPTDATLVIYTDSQLVVKGVTREFMIKANLDLFEELWSEVERIGVDRVRFVKVQGHSGRCDGNEAADALARLSLTTNLETKI